ncbi:MAG: VWA domain-containing protein [Anaerolineales bacterium]|nr:VWA domain-containing protein [Anaerolineales bacterium]
MPAPQDYYALLGVTRDASQEEIKRAYIEAAQKLHPDKNKAAGETEIFLGVQQAYETLSNPARRAQYDVTLPAEARASLPYQHRIIQSRASLTRLDEPQMQYLILELQPPVEAQKTASPPLNVSLVIDRSTSMQGQKMDMVKATAVQMLRNLRDQDIISVVAFSDRAQVIIPAAYHQERSRLESRIHAIQPSGATEIFQGLEAGVKEIMRSLDSKRLNHIILLTDGHTYGDEPQCLALAAKLAEQGIGVSGLGIGGEWNDIFLDALSARTGGSCALISDPQDIKRILLEKFNALAQTFAEEVVLELRPIEGVEISYVFRLQPDPAPIPMEGNKCRLGAILQDSSTRAIFECIIQPKAVKSDTLTFMDGTVKVSMSAQPTPVAPLRMRLSSPITDAPVKDPPPLEINQALSRLTLYRMQERARGEIEKGNFAAATRQLQTLASNLVAQGERSLAHTIAFEVDRLKEQQSLSDEGSKKIKFGTRALFLAAPKKELVQ